jgi:hypothetical protein
VQRGLCPSGKSGSKDKARTVHHYIDQDGVDFVCVQESGVRWDTCPPALSSVFSRSGHHLIVSGRHSANSYDTVAIAVHKQWKVARVFRMPSSSRCLAVELRQGPCTIFVASILLPTNLDQIPATTEDWGHKQTRAEVRRILAEVERWSAPYAVAIVCGDMNCTVDRTLDRKDDGDGPRAGNLLTETILSAESQFSDFYRELYPLEKGWTRKDARLDYALLKAPHSVGRVACFVDGGFPSDHEGVCLEIHAPGESLTAAKPQARSTFRVRGSSLAQRTDFVALANEGIAAVLRGWASRLGLATDDTERLHVVAWGQSALADAVTAAAVEAFPSPGPRAPDYRQQYYRCRITALRRMAKRVRRVAAGAISWSHWIGTSIGHEKKLHHVGLHPGFPLNDVSAWEEWAHLAEGEATRMMVVLAELNLVLSEAGDPSSFPERLWGQSRGKKSFFDKYFRPSCGPIESAVAADSGERTWDPRIYMDLVRTAVMKPFSTKVRLGDHDWALQSPCSGRCKPKLDKCKVPACGVEPVACGDIRCSGRPSWWDYWYGPSARVPGARAAFAHVGAVVTPDEVVSTVKKCDGGKSPGPDGVSIDLLKLLVGADLGPGRPATPASDVPLACLMAKLASESIKLGRMTQHITDGLIVMVPKGSIDGPPDVSEMRPITLLSEIGKVPGRILTARISATLCDKPRLLNISQRAFLRNGDVSQCIATILDVFEDHLAKRARNPGSQLFCVSYDLSKAYDSVQEYSIRASLERFEFPPEIVDYVCSSLWDSRSRVQTRDGPTEAFEVRSCVRQGDPLAPLIFILVLDVLHCGLEEICALDGYGVGLTGMLTRLASMGYADDTAIVADTEEGIRELHEWVRSFFGAHAFKINAKKTKFVSSVDPAQVRCLPGVDGITHIRALPSGTSFRYLGVMLNMECTWKEEFDRLEKLMWFVRGRILNCRIPLAPAVDAINTFLVSKMEVGLGLIPMTPKVVKALGKWTNALKDAAMNASAPQRITGLSTDGFCTVTDMANLAMMADCFRMGLAFERLNVRGSVVAPTARARLLCLAHEPVTSVNRLRHVPALARMEIRRNPGYSDPDLPILPVSEPESPGAPVTEVHAEARAWDPQDDVAMFVTPTRMTLTAFTDGSSVPGSRRCGGYSSVIFDGTGDCVEIGGHCKPSGMNYLSEITAILATLLSCPAQAALDIWTDCLSAKQAIERDDSAERARIRAAARPVLTCIRRAIRCRDQLGARTSFQHVRSHTGGDSFEEKGNSMADARANRERVDALHCESVPFLTRRGNVYGMDPRRAGPDGSHHRGCAAGAEAFSQEEDIGSVVCPPSTRGNSEDQPRRNGPPQ